MPKVLFLKGLPGGGKTFFANELLKKEPGKWKRVNKDELRLMVDGGHWSSMNEQFILAFQNLIIAESLANGMNVIVDNTNFEEKHFESLKEIVDLENKSLYKLKENLLSSPFTDKNEVKKILNEPVEIEVKFFDTPLETCIARDANREKPVGEKVIRGMYNKYLRVEPTPYPRNPTLPTCIIVDIDGTLAKMKGRSAYEWSRVGEDEPNKNIIDLVQKLNRDSNIVIFSGRDAVCRRETETWLAENRIKHEGLFMRPVGDTQKDSIVKQELFEQNIRGRWNVDFVLDDRDQVVKMWRSLGLTCLQVGEGNF